MLLARRLLVRGALGGSAALTAATAAASCERADSSQLFRLDGKVALVTGASRGIGFAIACGLAEQGASVVMSGTNPVTLAEARRALLTETCAPPESVSCVAFDVSDSEACVAYVRTVTI